MSRSPLPKLESQQRLLLLLSASFVLLMLLWWVPQWQIDQLPFLNRRRLQQLPITEQLQLELDENYRRAGLEGQRRNTLLLAILGVLGGMITYHLWRHHHKQVLRQDTNEFCKAVELLADKNKVEVRLGGIFLLEQIAMDSATKQAVVLEVLTAFIRENSPKAGDNRQLGTTEVNTLHVPTDIQAALTVISRCHLPSQGHTLDFQDAYLIQANLIQANLEGANFQRTYLIGTNLREANLQQANLRNADLLSANLSGANLTNANLSSANLLGTNLNSANFRAADLTGANLRGAYLGNANLLGTNLHSADLIGVYLSDANLSQAKLVGANLRSAKLIGAILTDTDFTEANLNGADLSDASLMGTDLTDANLRDVSFEGTQFKDTNLSGADLRGAIHLSIDQLADCRLCQTKLPDHIDLAPNRDCSAVDANGPGIQSE